MQVAKQFEIPSQRRRCCPMYSYFHWKNPCGRVVVAVRNAKDGMNERHQVNCAKEILGNSQRKVFRTPTTFSLSIAVGIDNSRAFS